ncbi:DsrE family protein [Muricauda sp. 334s03]|uniref:DsrE family protein n=1 Tax=Flagellimonas yonaguniensis TaxID=3031325 RepID=A0ABT5XXS6_9FLAO|nr:DsrE family protein [[Muricauda] yonaguniensis]MDF0715980.1 DsrE family protein [[Muricauda] yonaguniensis]
MKLSRFLILVSFWTFMTASNMFGQDKLDAAIVSDLQKTTQYAFGVSEERHFKGVLGLYDKLVASGVEVADYEIVVKGKVVKQLVKGSELEILFQKYKGKVRVGVCSVAMEKLGVSEDQLIPGMEPVATWTVRILQLQAKGYNTVTY